MPPGSTWSRCSRPRSGPTRSATEARRVKKFILRALMLAVAAYAAAVTALFVFQDRILFHGKAAYWSTPAAEGVPFEDVGLIASDGVKLHGWFIPALGVSR